MLYDTGKFKKRMQSLKAYREQNPDKGYWDWKIQSSQLGGSIEGEASLETIKQREWLRDWLSSRVDQMAENIDAYSNQKYYGSLTDRAHVAPFFFQDKRKNASKVIKEQLDFIDNVPVYDHREPWMRNDKSIPYIKEFARRLASDPHVRGSYIHEYGKQPAIHVSPITPIHDSVIVHELSHGTQDKHKIQTSKINDILQKYNNENSSLDKYYDDPNEIYSRLNQFRYENYLNPQDVISKEQIKQWKDSSIDKHDLIDRYSVDTLFELFNNVASTGNKKDNNIISAADGGKIKYENGDKVDNGYMAWRNSLPDNLRYTDDSEYDMRAAYESGAEPRLEDDGLWHLPSRDQRTGRILKKPWHETYREALETDAGLGYKAYLIGNETYTWNDKDGIFVPWQSDEVPSYADGGEDDNGDSNPFSLQNVLRNYNGPISTQLPTYEQVMEDIRENDPYTYNDIVARAAAEKSPNSEVVHYVDAEGKPASRANLTNAGLENGLLSGEDLPGIGDVLAAYQVKQDIQAGDYVNAGIGAGFLGLGLLSDLFPPIRPIVSGVGKGVRRLLRRSSKEVAEQIADGTGRVARDISRATDDVIGTNNISGLSDVQLSEEYMRDAIAQTNTLRDRVRSLPEGPVTPELYDELQQEYKRVSSLISNDEAFERMRRNNVSEIPSEIWHLRARYHNILGDIVSQADNHPVDYSSLFRHTDDYLRTSQQVMNDSYDRLETVLDVYEDWLDRTPAPKNSIQNVKTLVRDEPYDPNNLPEEFINRVLDPNDYTGAAYFNMTAREAIQQAERDFSNLRHGQAWNLTTDNAVSTDSYPLQLNMMRSHQDDGMIKVLLDKYGSPEYMRLNYHGNLIGDPAIKRINKKLNMIGEIIGRDDLKAIKAEPLIMNGQVIRENIEVPKILFRRYADGGENENENIIEGTHNKKIISKRKRSK